MLEVVLLSVQELPIQLEAPSHAQPVLLERIVSMESRLLVLGLPTPLAMQHPVLLVLLDHTVPMESSILVLGLLIP